MSENTGTFSPFAKPIDALEEADLQVLLTDKVTEGYYVEYKSIPPLNSKIGHSIASFSNTQGGWYIVGVTTDGNNVAAAIPGFDVGSWPDPVTRFRDVVRTHIDPVPLFFTRVVPLGTGKSVFIVQVPDGQDAPFITKDGRIYRRTSDSSEPVAENDRYALDRLYERVKVARDRFAAFCQDERTFAKGESEWAWAQVFLSPYPYGSIDRPELLETESIAKLIEGSRLARVLMASGSPNPISGNLPFESGYPTPQSVVLQQRGSADLAYNSLTAEVFVDGRARLQIPLRWLRFSRADLSALESKKAAAAIGAVAKADGDLALLRFIDIGQLWLSVATLVTWYGRVAGWG